MITAATARRDGHHQIRDLGVHSNGENSLELSRGKRRSSGIA